MATLIDPSKWPVIDSEKAEQASKSFNTMGTSTAKDVGELNTEWKKLAPVYKAPEQDKVLDLQEPAVKAANELKDKFVKASGYISTYATDLADIKRRLDGMRKEAQDFHDEATKGYDVVDYDRTVVNLGVPIVGLIRGEGVAHKHVNWDQHGPAVDRNNELVGKLNAILADLSKTESETAKKIDGLVDHKRLDAARKACTPRGDYRAYSADELNQMDAPWGSKGDRVPSGVLDNIATAGGQWVKGTFFGLTSLVGIDEHGISWDTFKRTWGNIGDTLGSCAWVITVLIPKEIAYVAGDKDALNLSDWELRRVDKAGQFSFGFFGLDYERFKESGDLKDAVYSWRTNPWGTGTTTLLNIGSLFVAPETAAGKGASMLARTGLVARGLAAVRGLAVADRIPGMARIAELAGLTKKLPDVDSLPKPHVSEPVGTFPKSAYAHPHEVAPNGGSVPKTVHPGENPGLVAPGSTSTGVQKFLDRVDSLGSNLKGRAGELMTRMDLEAKGYIILGEDAAVVRNAKGEIFRPDFVALDPVTKEILVIDSKFAQKPGFTRGQTEGYPYSVETALKPGSGTAAQELQRNLEKYGLTGRKADGMRFYDWNKIAPNDDLLRALERDLASGRTRATMDPKLLTELQKILPSLR